MLNIDRNIICVKGNSKCFIVFLVYIFWVIFKYIFHCRILASQLQTQGQSHEKEVEGLRAELQRLKAELGQQQQMMSDSLQLPHDARIQASLQHEISRLTQQNMVCTHSHWHIYMYWQQLMIIINILLY